MSDSHSPLLPQPSLTFLLDAWRGGDGAALADVLECAYDELRRIAGQRLAQSNGAATLTPTELLHESAVRILEGANHWQSRAHFYASMSLCMRSILVDHARARQSRKHGGALLRVSIGQMQAGEESVMPSLLALDAALKKLEALDSRSSSVLHLSYFAGLGRVEIAEVMGVAVQVIDREMRFGKTWLNAELGTHL